MVENINRPVN